jgi:tRNA (guanine-N7-)-methyltransferase
MRRNWRGEDALGRMDAVLQTGLGAVYPDWAGVFGRHAPLQVEIGSGKGDFIIASARLNPDVDYVGIERSLSVLYVAAKKNEENPKSNLRFMAIDARVLNEYFPAESIERIFLNFSDPWPKTRHASRRLTAKPMLSVYRGLLKPGGQILFKTDQALFFEFSMKEFINESWSVGKICRDLHNSGIEGNIMTEYERRFATLGMPIYCFTATRSADRAIAPMAQTSRKHEYANNAKRAKGVSGAKHASDRNNAKKETVKNDERSEPDMNDTRSESDINDARSAWDKKEAKHTRLALRSDSAGRAKGKSSDSRGDPRD